MSEREEFLNLSGERLKNCYGADEPTYTTKLSAFLNHFKPKMQYSRNAIEDCQNYLQSKPTISDEDAIKTADLMAKNLPRNISFRLRYRFMAVENHSDLKDAMNRLIKFLEEDIQNMERLLGEVAAEGE